MELNVQQFLRNGGALADLTERWAIKVKRHPEYNNLVMLKYDQIASQMAEPIVQDCRGIILDEAANWNIICFSFRKFFNHGEVLAAPIDWKTARVEEKLDGSLCQVYFYDGKWHVASSGMPAAQGNVMSTQLQGEETFAELFWKTWKVLDFRLPLPWEQHLTFTFELMTQQNRVVVPHKESRLVLLGVRDNITGQQYRTCNWVEKYPIARTFPLQSWEQCVKAAEAIDPMKQEGYVVVDGDWNRVKMKAPQYVAMSHIKDTACGPRAVLEVVRQNESTEFLAYFPEWKPTFDDVRAKFEALVAETEGAYTVIKDIPVQKDFALLAVKSKCSGALFRMRKGQINYIRDHFAEMNIKALAELLSIKEEDLVVTEA